MKKILVLFVFMFSYLFAIDKATVIQAVKANPALLNTPQAQQIMKQEGVTKQQVLKKIDVSTTTNNIVKQNTNIENNIQTKQDIENKDTKKIVLQENSVPILKPLQFLPEKELVKKIQSIQQQSNTKHLNRFGEKFFYNKNKLNTSILSVPDYYQVNKGDLIEIQIFGANDKTLDLTIDNNGDINIPILGPIYIAGKRVSELQKLIQSKLGSTYPNSKILVNVKINSYIQVSLTGFVKSPGIYNLTSLSTIKDLLIQANGFGKLGSMRNVYLKRDGKTLKIIDFYKLIKNGDLVDRTLLRNGDIIYVPKAKKLVELSGAVNIPAIYELKKDEKLKNLIFFAGGLNVDASKKFIKIKRFENNSYTKILFENINSNVNLFNGDKIYVYKISELNKNLVYVYGNIEKPGTFEIPKDKKLKTLLKSLIYLKDTYYKYGLIERFNGKIVSFNLKTPKNLKLSYKDKIYIFNKYEILPAKFITVNGKILKNPGKYKYLKGMTLKDAINNTGFNQPFYPTKIKIISYDKEMKPILHFINYTKDPNYKLKPFDEITFFSYYDFNPLKPITIVGAVHKPGTYIYSKNMTLYDLMMSAGWITDKADKNYIEVIRYKIENNKRVKTTLKLNFYYNLYDKLQPEDIVRIYQLNTVPLKKITIQGAVYKPNSYTYIKDMTLKDLITLAGGITDKADKNYIELIRYKIENSVRKRSIIRLSFKDLNQSLKPYDEITIKKIPNWNEKEVVVIGGEVKYPGTYTIKKGDKLYDIIKRAGGFTKNAYLYGAVFTRESIKKMQEARIQKMIYKLKKKVSIISASAKGAGEGTLNAQGFIAAIDNLAQQAEKLKPIGRIAINLDSNLNQFKNSKYNISLQSGDKLYIPTKPDSIIVLGEVLTPTAFVYTNNSALKYIKQAGGTTDMAENIYFVVHANGFTEKGEFGWFGNDVNVKSGDAITVPIKIATTTWYGIAKDITSIVYQLAITAASLKTVGAL